MPASGPLRFTLARQNAVEEDSRQIGSGALVEGIVVEPSPGQRADLGIEIRVVLRGGPDREDEMLRVERPHQALANPALDGTRLRLDEIEQRARQRGIEVRGPL